MGDLLRRKAVVKSKKKTNKIVFPKKPKKEKEQLHFYSKDPLGLVEDSKL